MPPGNGGMSMSYVLDRKGDKWVGSRARQVSPRQSRTGRSACQASCRAMGVPRASAAAGSSSCRTGQQ